MDLPSAADNITQHLETLNTTMSKISETVTELVNPTHQSLQGKINQLRAEIRGNAFKDYIRQEVQTHNDQILAQKINEVVDQFSCSLKELSDRIAVCEKQAGHSDIHQVDDAASAERNEAEAV
jgi:uncharacterized protein YukE